MTTQDLIIGHYEGTLTRAEQAKLDGLLASSPETRTLFEQHGVMEEKMKEESEELAPPFGLREATLGAALGTAASTIGGGIATWITGKFVIAVSTVVIGGAAVGLGIALSGDDEPATKNPTSAVTTGMEEGSEELNSVSDPVEALNEENAQMSETSPASTSGSNTSAASNPGRVQESTQNMREGTGSSSTRESQISSKEAGLRINPDEEQVQMDSTPARVQPHLK